MAEIDDDQVRRELEEFANSMADEELEDENPPESKFCEYEIRQGSRKGQKCGNRALHKVGNLHLCIRHRHMAEKKKEPKIHDESGEELKKPEPETKKTSKKEKSKKPDPETKKPESEKPKKTKTQEPTEEVEMNLDEDELESISKITALNKDEEEEEESSESSEEPQDELAIEKEAKVKEFLNFFAYKAFLNVNASGEAILQRFTPLVKGYTSELEKNEYTKQTFEEFMEDCGGEERLLEALSPATRLLVVMGLSMASTIRKNLVDKPATKNEEPDAPKPLPAKETKLLDAKPESPVKVKATSDDLDAQLMEQFPDLFKKK